MIVVKIIVFFCFIFRIFTIMSTKAIYEATGKKLLNKYLDLTATECRCVSIDANTHWDELVGSNPWLKTDV